MLKEKFQALILKQKEGTNKKKIENLVVLIIILIVTIIAINYIWKDDNKEKNKNNQETAYKKLAEIVDEDVDIKSTKDDLEQRLENILTKIDGVGSVSVLITYSQTNEIIPMYNESSKNSSTEETDSEGGIRTINEQDSTKEIIYKEEGGVNIPVTQKVVSPKIEGAVITAVGANNPSVRSNIIQAVEAVTGIATHKIQVFEMKSN